MQDLYAVTFALASDDGSDALLVAAERTSEWLRSRVSGVDLTSPGSVERESPNGTTVRWAHRDASAPHRRAIDAVLEHPDSYEQHDRWRAAVVLTDDDGSTRATVRISRGTTRHELRPRPVRFSPPSIVKRLLERPLHGYAGALEVSVRARRLGHEEVTAFVRDVISNDDRVLPLLVCDIGAAAPDGPNDIALRLAGLAHVVVLQSVEAWELLRHDLPQAYVPYGGAALYWPGFVSDRHGRHRYFTRRDLRTRPLGSRLDRWLRSLAVQQVPRDRLPDRLRILEFRTRANEAVAATPVAAPDESELLRLRKQVAELDDWIVEVEQAQDTIAQLEQRNQSLATELAVSQANVEQLTRFDLSRDTEPEEDDQPTGAPVPPVDWGEGFEEALDELTSPALAFTERARACARRNNYRRPRDMFDALVGLEGLARLYHDGDGELGGRIVDVARLRAGLTIALQDNSYTSTRFTFEEQELDRLPHVKIDDHTAATEVGRIYFALDRANSRLVVDWFGVKDERPDD